MIKHNLPYVSDEDIEAVSKTLRSGWIAHGNQVYKLESDFVSYHKGGDSCACSSGTAALFLALKSIGIKNNNRVYIPTYACTALLNAINMAEAMPVVCDVDPETFCIIPNSIQNADCTIAVHTFGKEADIETIKENSNLVIEDCCQSIGSFDNANSPIGKKGDAAVFSFYATKIITCGHGGLVWSYDRSIVERAKDYRDFDGRLDYKPRFNFHMSDIEASMVQSQFKRLDFIHKRRKKIARMYLEAINGKFPVQSGIQEEGRMVYRFVVLADNQKIRDILKKQLENAGIQTIIPIERYELLHRYLSLPPEQFPNAERLADTTLSIPIYPLLTDEQVDLICNELSRI